MRGIVVCVGYDDLLAVTLPNNVKHFSECLVVTSPGDAETHRVCQQVPNVKVLATDAFTRHGATFNKGLAIEEGFEQFGRYGWICVWDADTLLPPKPNFGVLECGNLYSARRRIVNDVLSWSEDIPWSEYPISGEVGMPGYLHLFHANDPAIATLPWYDLRFIHAGGGDGYFQSRWPQDRKRYMPFEVLHLGPKDTNWFGRVSERMDGTIDNNAYNNQANMERYLRFKGWHRPNTVLEFQEKIDVPNAPETGFVPQGADQRRKKQRKK